MDVLERVEHVPIDRVIWQSMTAKTYYCDKCLRWVRSQYEGNDPPIIICEPGEHRLEWRYAQ